MTGVSARILRIFEEKYLNRCETRFGNLLDVYRSLSKHVASKDANIEVLIDTHKLYDLIRSYFIDVIRYKEYHFDAAPAVDPFSKEWADQVHAKDINASKVATITAKWILKYKPISVHTKRNFEEAEHHELTFYLANINEHFAFQSALSALDVELGDVPDVNIEEFIYNFRFRPFDEGPYYMIFESLYKESERKKKESESEKGSGIINPND